MNLNLTKFEEILKDKQLDAFIVSNPTNIFYLTGFRGLLATDREAFLVVSNKITLITAKLYQHEALSARSGKIAVKIVRERNEMIPAVAKLITHAHPRGVKIGFEEDDLTYEEYAQLEKISRLKLVPKKDLIGNLRLIKTADEIEKIEKAQAISQKAFATIIKTIKVGQTEEEIAETLAKIIKSLGGQGLAFESIIASGTNSGKPHHRTSAKKIKKGEILLLDFGAKYQDYCGDLSRTVFIGKPKDSHRNLFNHVQTAQRMAIKKIESGTQASTAYKTANDHFKKHKLEGFFLHGLGHGIGLAVHEPPYLRPTTKDTLGENMVFSVEPGLYFPWGGIRIEDLVAIINHKAKILGQWERNLTEIYP